MRVEQMLHDTFERYADQAPASPQAAALVLAAYRRSQRRRRSAAVVGAAVVISAATLVVPTLAGRGTTPSSVGFADESPTGPYDEQGGVTRALDAYGCPDGTTLVRAGDDTGATAVVRAADDDAVWLCSGITPTGDATSFFSGPWDEYAVIDESTPTWLGPLTIDSCAGTPCDGLMWSAVGTVPAGVSKVTVLVAGDPESHDAAVADGYWALRLQRPTEDNTRGDTTSTINGDTLLISVAFAWQEPSDDTDKPYLVVNDEFRDMCRAVSSTVTRPPWNQNDPCTDEALQHNLNTTAFDYEGAMRYTANCQWYAELLVASDTGQTERVDAALTQIDEAAQWSGNRGTGFDTQIEDFYEAAVAGDLSPIRQLFPGCGAEYLDQAGAWTP